MYPAPQMVPIERGHLLGLEYGQRPLDPIMVQRICTLTKMEPDHDLQSAEGIIVHKDMYDYVRDYLQSDGMEPLNKLLTRAPEAWIRWTGGQHQWSGVYQAFREDSRVKLSKALFPAYLYIFPDWATAKLFTLEMVGRHQDVQGLHSSTLNTQNLMTGRALLCSLGYGVGDDAPTYTKLSTHAQESLAKVTDSLSHIRFGVMFLFLLDTAITPSCVDRFSNVATIRTSRLR